MNAAKNSLRVLVVDDNEDGANLLQEWLRCAGHDVRAARDGAAALEAARTFHPQVILLDIGLPGMDGYEVARALREGGLDPGALLVAVTGYGQPADRARTSNAGFDEHLVKPVDLDALTRLVDGYKPKP